MVEQKIGIVTLNGYRNYGNILQNLALQRFLIENGINSETIWCNSRSGDSKLEKIKKHLRDGNLISTLNYQIKMRFLKEYKILELNLQNREKTFEKFCDENIKYSEFQLDINSANNNEKSFKVINDFYDTFLIGSDQVWGLNGQSYPKMFFLPFAEKNKRNSFAASFGFSQIPQKKLIHKYKNGLEGMNCISVREKSAQSIVRNLINRDVELILDPVFLLGKNEWKNFENDDLLAEGKRYLLTYFLGKKTKKYEMIIKSISKKRNLEIIELNNINNLKYFSISPADFINFFDKAAYVVTDSFHGTAFSILFKKRFIVLDRKGTSINMNSRLIDLLDMTELSNRFIKNGVEIKDIVNIEDKINFDVADKIIDNNKLNSKKFLKRVLN